MGNQGSVVGLGTPALQQSFGGSVLFSNTAWSRPESASSFSSALRKFAIREPNRCSQSAAI
jgi:hypothetical protein